MTIHKHPTIVKVCYRKADGIVGWGLVITYLYKLNCYECIIDVHSTRSFLVNPIVEGVSDYVNEYWTLIYWLERHKWPQNCGQHLRKL